MNISCIEDIRHNFLSYQVSDLDRTCADRKCQCVWGEKEQVYTYNNWYA